jgi:MFS family permease
LSSEFVLLTIAVYMAVQGIAPLLWMPLGDYFGRRFALIATLAVFVGANAGLLFSKSFISLMLLRALQAFGTASFSMIGETTMLLDLVADSRLIDMQGVLLLGTYQLDRREEASLAFMLQVRIISCFWTEPR